ncbi:hypothetical protein [Dethiobacter alkaliphilus]|uniref:Uncharacterized protein n=1 Tax=Dethiobacter alkaliphilus AHT 1 TaxID=555088 RepID=C0GGY5_DETAL|nr:hypothetical protein [Dethiobacter alkaliphilus]EEG77287.1 hypothetical protein DealDRAFT_1744 [Dethiobacter alkaliphilus AHT 1]
MPKINRVLLVLTILLLLLAPAQALARSFYFPSVEIDAQVQEDGSMLITSSAPLSLTARSGECTCGLIRKTPSQLAK